MIILGIETSCDETAAAVIDVRGPAARPRVRVLASVVASQVKLHAKYGGVVPHLAKREHQRNLVPTLLTALTEAKLRNPKSEIRNPKQIRNPKFKILNSVLEREPELVVRLTKWVTPMSTPRIDAIAVTIGPGLAPALWTGVNFARALAHLWNKPLIPVNHLEGHIYTNLLPSGWTPARSVKLLAVRFPVLCLIVSGGHTELVIMRRPGNYRVIGETLDDAAGEAFDKVAKMMRLGFPGGPVISRLAEHGNPSAFAFPRPMLVAKNFDFSFSGLKTAVLYALRDMKAVSHAMKCDVAASFQEAAVDVLVAKTIRAAREHSVKTVMIGGGVAANKKLRADLARRLTRDLPGVDLLLPDPKLTGDNALMIALAGWFRRKEKSAPGSLKAKADLSLEDR